MNDVTYDETVETETGPCPPPDAPKPETAEPVKAWIVGYGELGLINIVADSQEELVARVEDMRCNAGASIMSRGANSLESVEVLSNNPTVTEVSTIWIDPLLILAVMDQFEPRTARGMPGLPPGLEALLKTATVGDGPEVVVVEEDKGGE